MRQYCIRKMVLITEMPYKLVRLEQRPVQFDSRRLFHYQVEEVSGF